MTVGDIEEGILSKGSSHSLLEPVLEGESMELTELAEMPLHDLERGEHQQQQQQQQQGESPLVEYSAPLQQQTNEEQDESKKSFDPLALLSTNSSNNDDATSAISSDEIKQGSSSGRNVRFHSKATPDANLRGSSRRGLFRGANHRASQGQQVQIRNLDMCAAMDETKRRKQQLKRMLSSWFGIIGDDDEDDEEAMMPSMHGRLMVQPSRMILKENESADINDEEAEERKRESTQYRLTTVKKSTRGVNIIPGMYEDTTSLQESVGCCWFCPNILSDRMTSKFMHWSFRSPFIVVFGTAAIGWFSMTFIFACFIWLIGEFQPYCICSNFSHADSPNRFADAYEMSWTTFSTVGYGLIYPAVSSCYNEDHRCTLITMLSAFESFVGVLFSSLCAALMFAKVGRVQSFAQVSFSDPIVIRYGTGVMPDEGNCDDEDDCKSNSSDKKITTTHIPCPVLEFRMFNRLSSLPGGEIIDATVNMVAAIDASQAELAMQGTRGRRKKGKKKRGAARNNRPAYRNGFDDVDDKASTVHPANTDKPSIVQRTQPIASRDARLPERGPAPALRRSHSQPRLQFDSTTDVRQSYQPLPSTGRFPGRGQQPFSGRGFGRQTVRGSHWSGNVLQRLPSLRIGRQRQDSDVSLNGFFGGDQLLRGVSMRNKFTQAYEEDPSGKLIPKKILSKLDVESPDHPFFRRTWLIRHTLDMNSLLLKPQVRRMLCRNRGFWPPELNNYESVRASIEFDQILVSLSGTSNADANSVYAQHVYHMADVNIGYRFVDALYRDPVDNSLKVDHKLINDVTEQAGGGGEPLQCFDAERFQDMLVL